MKRIAILGSGLLGCDLLVKCLRESDLEVVGFAGQDASSNGLAFARARGVLTTHQSINGLFDQGIKPDVVIDCTTASSHLYHYKVSKSMGVKMIDMTPAKLGVPCCPAINLDRCLPSDNINMISCGGQAAIPLCFAMKEVNPDIDYVEVVSTVASASVGPGTRSNISEYILATQKAIQQMLNIAKVKVMVNISPANPPLIMRTTVVADSAQVSSLSATARSIDALVERTRRYIPGYQASMQLSELGPKAMCQVVVSGCGDYLPKYAGNLDIINCAALEVIRAL